MDYQKKIVELEQIVKKMETENLSLEESIAAFEKGILLSKECQEKLSKAELKIQTLMSNGELVEGTDGRGHSG